MPVSARDRRALIGGGAAVGALLLYLLWPGGSPAPPPPAPEPLPPPAPPLLARPAIPAPTPVDVSGLRLFGVMASGAVIGMADGAQRFVPVGRELLPGVRLERVELHHAVLATPAGELRLGFDGAAVAASPPPAAVAAPASESALREESLRYRLGLAPRREGGRVTGFAVRPGADLPALARAGLRPGDVIVSVNGSRFDEERMGELAWQIANSARTEFEVERGGRILRLSLEGR